MVTKLTDALYNVLFHASTVLSDLTTNVLKRSHKTNGRVLGQLSTIILYVSKVNQSALFTEVS